jgi:hypothetical protein
MDWTGWYSAARAWAETQRFNVPEFAGLGVIAAAIIAVWVIWHVLRAVLKLGERFSDAATTRALRKDSAPGYRVLIAEIPGLSGRRFGKWFYGAVETHLATFNFGAPFRLGQTSAISGGLDPKSVRRARKLMAAADADLIGWAQRLGKGEGDFIIHGLARGGGLSPADARTFSFVLPGKFSSLNGRVPQLAAYLTAKALQPAIGNPQAFRPEKMKEMAAEIAAILAESDGIAAPVREQLEADYCAACVHVAEVSGDLDAIDQVIALRTRHLERLTPSDDPNLMVQARMDLGRALLARAEKQFDQRTVQQAILHLSAVVEALRADPAIQRAQGASDAMFKAQTMIETRKRFSVNFGA